MGECESLAFSQSQVDLSAERSFKISNLESLSTRRDSTSPTLPRDLSSSTRGDKSAAGMPWKVRSGPLKQEKGTLFALDEHFALSSWLKVRPAFKARWALSSVP
jgi:hypothetical protein